MIPVDMVATGFNSLPCLACRLFLMALASNNTVITIITVNIATVRAAIVSVVLLPPSSLFTGPLGPGLGVVDTVEEYDVEEIPEILFSLTITSCLVTTGHNSQASSILFYLYH